MNGLRAGALITLAVLVAACGGGGRPGAAGTPSEPSATTLASRAAPTEADLIRSPPAATPTTTRTPQATQTPQPSPREFTIVATGDVLLHERLWTQARRDASAHGPDMNFAPQLKGIRPVVNDAGLAICHLETPLAARQGRYEGYPTFSSPPQIVSALIETGYDACTTASNHTFDQGAQGVDRTLDTLDDAGLAHAGSARSADEAATPTLITVKTPVGPVIVGLLSYTYGFNGLPYPGGQRWRGNVIDKSAILDAAAKAREAGAEFVIVSMHWGDEYRHEPNAMQQDMAPALLASDDIDLLLGHHAHVVQPLENIGGEWVAYGLGNLMAAHRAPTMPRSEGILVRFTVTEDPATESFTTTGAEYLPILQTDTFPVGVVNVPAALDGKASPGTASKARLRTALERTTQVVNGRDGADHGLTLLDRPG